MENLNAGLEKEDEKIVHFADRWAVPMSKFALFVIYFYFGAIKVFAEDGAANPLVASLLDKTMPGVAASPFLIVFGVFEMLIGIIILIPRLERLGIFLLLVHLITTISPLFLLPSITWASPFVPTLEGQYIIKNILIVALALGILSHLEPLRKQA